MVYGQQSSGGDLHIHPGGRELHHPSHLLDDGDWTSAVGSYTHQLLGRGGDERNLYLCQRLDECHAACGRRYGEQRIDAAGRHGACAVVHGNSQPHGGWQSDHLHHQPHLRDHGDQQQSGGRLSDHLLGRGKSEPFHHLYTRHVDSEFADERDRNCEQPDHGCRRRGTGADLHAISGRHSHHQPYMHDGGHVEQPGGQLIRSPARAQYSPATPSPISPAR